MIRVLAARIVLAAFLTGAVALAMHSAGKLGAQLEMTTPGGSAQSSAPATPVDPVADLFVRHGCWVDDGLAHPVPTHSIYDGKYRGRHLTQLLLEQLGGADHGLNFSRLNAFCP